MWTKKFRQNYFREYYKKYKLTPRGQKVLKRHQKRSNEKYKIKYHSNPEYRALVLNRERERLRKLQVLRNKIFVEHDNKCDRCGFNDPRALHIHHHFSNQNKDNYYKEMKELIERKVPFSVLCANCHMILHNPKKLSN